MAFLPPGKHLEYGTVLGDERAILNEKEDASHGSFEHLADGTVQGVQEEGELLAPAHMGSREFDAAQKSRTSGGNLGQVLLADDARDVPRGVIATDDAPVVQEADDGPQRLVRRILIQLVCLAGIEGEGLGSTVLPDVIERRAVGDTGFAHVNEGQAEFAARCRNPGTGRQAAGQGIFG